MNLDREQGWPAPAGHPDGTRQYGPRRFGGGGYWWASDLPPALSWVARL